MAHDIIDTRRFFRNRFECYITNRDSSCPNVHVGSTITLQQLCDRLSEDDEEFPSRFDPDMKSLCGHEHMIYFRGQRTYGDVAKLLNRMLAGQDCRLPPIAGRWVRAVLRSSDDITTT